VASPPKHRPDRSPPSISSAKPKPAKTPRRSPRLETAEVSVAAKSGGNGKLFGAVTNADIAAAIERTLGVAVDRHKIVLPENIKSLGSYPIEVRLGKSVVAKTTVKVVASAT
jgi:large subunit ribosomal protein L9